MVFELLSIICLTMIIVGIGLLEALALKPRHHYRVSYNYDAILLITSHRKHMKYLQNHMLSISAKCQRLSPPHPVASASASGLNITTTAPVVRSCLSRARIFDVRTSSSARSVFLVVIYPLHGLQPANQDPLGSGFLGHGNRRLRAALQDLSVI